MSSFPQLYRTLALYCTRRLFGVDRGVSYVSGGGGWFTAMIFLQCWGVRQWDWLCSDWITYGTFSHAECLENRPALDSTRCQ